MIELAWNRTTTAYLDVLGLSGVISATAGAAEGFDIAAGCHGNDVVCSMSDVMLSASMYSPMHNIQVYREH